MTGITHAEARRFAVLHLLSVSGFAAQDAISRQAGIEREAVADEVASASAAGLVSERTGRLAGWLLTEAGRREHARLLAAELDAAGCRETIEKAYERFLDLNGPFKAVCTRWQLRTSDAGTQVPNDHGDPGYDRAVIADLGGIHRGVLPVTGELSRALSRFGRYERELRSAWERLSAGERRAFAAPMSGSYHDAWMHLHQDLMTTLGRKRSAADGH